MAYFPRFRLALLLSLLVAFLLPALASASCTWSRPAGTQATWKVVCTTANEAAPTLATEGADLSALSNGFEVVAEADSGQTFTATPGGSVAAYRYVAIIGAWYRVPDLDLPITLASQRRQSWAPFITLVDRDRIAFIPTSATVSAGGFTVWIIGKPKLK